MQNGTFGLFFLVAVANVKSSVERQNNPPPPKEKMVSSIHAAVDCERMYVIFRISSLLSADYRVTLRDTWQGDYGG